MDQTHLGYYYWQQACFTFNLVSWRILTYMQQPMTNTMPAVNRVAAKKQALAGPMRITIEGKLSPLLIFYFHIFTISTRITWVRVLALGLSNLLTLSLDRKIQRLAWSKCVLTKLKHSPNA